MRDIITVYRLTESAPLPQAHELPLWTLKSERLQEELVYLSEGDDQLTQVLFSAVETDVVVGDEQLSNHVHLCERRPERAVCVPVQTLVLCQPEHQPVPLILCPRVQVSAAAK